MKTKDALYPRADILLYAHDGRGLGHISRSVAIGLAVCRLSPVLRVLLVTGGAQTQELIGAAPLDWLKLPAYQTDVVAGRSRGIDGKSGYRDSELATIRAEHIRQIVKLYRPRLVLADHSPQGKHKELQLSLEDVEIKKHTRWLLGMRGVIGRVKQTYSDLAIELFKQNYSNLLWYGDSTVLGTEHCQNLNSQFSTKAVECGYVSRLTELKYLAGSRGEKNTGPDCTISVPWAGEMTHQFLELLAKFLENNDTGHRIFRLFLGDDIAWEAKKRFEHLARCRVEPFGSTYPDTLVHSQHAIIYGGYNSLVDVIAAGKPALVILRNMQDQEQQQHLAALADKLPDNLFIVEEQDCVDSPILLEQKLLRLLSSRDDRRQAAEINLSGAESAARFLVSSLKSE